MSFVALHPGKELSFDEELRLRGVIDLLVRIEGNREQPEPSRASAREDRRNLERFLPEASSRWTAEELQLGADASLTCSQVDVEG